MHGIRKVAGAYYDRASAEEKYRAKQFFESLDVDRDGRVGLSEFKASADSWYNDEDLFKQLDANGDGTLDFSEALSLYYIQKVGIPKCDGCRAFLVEPYFSCFLCQGNAPHTFDLCCSCYEQGKVQHQHPLSNFQDNHSLFKLFRKCTIDAQTPQVKKGMDELRKIAQSHYGAGSPEVQALADNFFNSLDTDGDGKVDLPEFLAFMRQEGYTHMRNPHFFKDLDRDGSGTLDFWEVMTLYYIIKSGRPFCCHCGNFIPGVFFSCVDCFDSTNSSFDLCHDCYQSTKCTHNHNGQSQFLDNYTLLETKRYLAPTRATDVNQNEQRGIRNAKAGSPMPSNAIVPASSTNLPISNNERTCNTYIVLPPTAEPSTSNAIVPASKTNKWKAALTAFEIGLGIGSISTTLCSIL